MNFTCITCLYRFLVQALLPLNPTIPCRRARPNSKSREYALLYSPLSFALFVGTLARLNRYEMDDVSKVTLPTWPGQGMDATWLSSGLLVPFVFLSILGCYFVFRCYLDRCIVSFCILARWSRCCIYMFFCGSVVNNCNVTTPPASRVFFDVHAVLGGRLGIVIMRILAGSAKTA